MIIATSTPKPGGKNSLLYEATDTLSNNHPEVANYQNDKGEAMELPCAPGSMAHMAGFKGMKELSPSGTWEDM